MKNKKHVEGGIIWVKSSENIFHFIPFLAGKELVEIINFAAGKKLILCRIYTPVMYLNVSRFYDWLTIVTLFRYIRLQRQKAILETRLKIPPPINQFRANTLDKQTGGWDFYTR